jgi:hypothetical protein
MWHPMDSETNPPITDQAIIYRRRAEGAWDYGITHVFNNGFLADGTFIGLQETYRGRYEWHPIPD